MKKTFLICLLLAVLALTSCTFEEDETTETPTVTESETAETSQHSSEAESESETETETETAAPHSKFYLPQYSVDDVVLYFNEVCLQAEYSTNGNPHLIQKWAAPISYALHGKYTQEDLSVLRSFVELLNSIEGFPGIYETKDSTAAVLQIYFCTEQELVDRIGGFAEQESLDGAVTFWYNGMQEITNAIICIRTDLSQNLRNSVILEELYNGLGPIQDTLLRPDSIIYQAYSEVQKLSEMDILILQLLYHTQIRCGMTAEQCESVIKTLYY